MFKKFKNRRAANKLANQASEKEHNTLCSASTMLQLQVLNRNNLKPSKFLESIFTRGYIVGFFSAAMELTQTSPKEVEDFVILINLGHLYLFSGDALLAKAYTFDSLSLMFDKNKEFTVAFEIGFEQYMNAVKSDKKALGLMAHMMEFKDK